MQALSCKRCKQQLRIDDSLTDLDATSMDLLIAPLNAEEQYQRQLRQLSTTQQDGNAAQGFEGSATNHGPISRRYVGVRPPPGVLTNTKSTGKMYLNMQRDNIPMPSESYVMLTRSQISQQQSLQPSSPNNGQGASSNFGPSMSSPLTGPADSAGNSPSHQRSASSTSNTNAGRDLSGSLQSPRNNSLSHRLKVASRLFDVMSSKSSVDHPMCQECTDMLLESLKKQLKDASHERDCYIEFLKKVKDSRVSEDEEKELKKQVEELKLAEEEAMADLKKAQEQYEQEAQELAMLEKEMKTLEEEEEVFWQKCNDYQLKLQTFQNERDSINLKYDHDVKEYERLQKTVVYKDAFCIGQDGPFGTINGFRLGRLSTHPVEWNEINAAWGQTLLLLYTVAKKLKFDFKTYQLVPLGSFSRVEKIDGDSVLSYELFGSGELGINRMFLNRRFDHAMVAMLACLKQLADYAEEKDKTLRFPYRINKDKIGDISIRLRFNQDELWTKALQYMLTNMKWILVFASRANVTIDPPITH